MTEAASAGRYYEIFDVFADKALAGNPLAVVHESEGLTDARMQAIAREFNLSETVFIFPPENPMHEAAVRILPRTTSCHLPVIRRLVLRYRWHVIAEQATSRIGW